MELMEEIQTLFADSDIDAAYKISALPSDYPAYNDAPIRAEYDELLSNVSEIAENAYIYPAAENAENTTGASTGITVGANPSSGAAAADWKPPVMPATAGR